MSSDHFAERHYQPIIGGSAVDHIGRPSQMRQVTLLVRAFVDRCEPCQESMLDAVAIDGELMRTLHCLYNAITKGVLIPAESEQGREIAVQQWQLPFVLRRAGAEKEASAIAARMAAPQQGWA